MKQILITIYITIITLINLETISASCVNCKGTCDANDQCLIDCPQGEYSFNGYCEQQKPPNTYCNKSLQCSECKTLTCIDCKENLQDCQKCQDGVYLINGVCEMDRPLNTYCDSYQCQKCADQSNLPCPNYCDSQLQCINSCKQGEYFLQNKCLPKKPSNTYCNPKTKICSQCKQSSCEECDSGLTNCISCKANTYLYEQECKTEKPKNTYCSQFNACYKCADSSNQPCNQYCDESLQCVNKCQQDKYFYNGICYDSKPPGTYCDNQTLECLQCKQPSLYECDSTLIKGTKCKLGEYLYENKCVARKPANTFCTNEGVCQKCQDSTECEVACDETLKCITTKCQFDNVYYNGTCSMSKPFNVGCDPNTLLCQKCDSGISTCANCDHTLKSCLVCYPDFYMFQDNCNKIQPKNAYCDNNKVCQTCQDSSNQPCDGQCNSNLQCIPTDTKDKYILNGIYSEQIPEKSFCNPITKICQPCQKSECQTCDSSLKICTSCKPDQIFFNQECYKNQPINTYCQNKKDCQICNDKSQKPCSNYCNSKLQCINCKENEYEYEGNCLSTRPQKAYCDDNQKCFKCKENSCESCDSTLIICLACSSNKYLFEGFCYTQKPLGSYCNLYSKDQTNSFQICEKCYKNCKDCTGPSEKECEDCKKQDSNQNPLCSSGTTVVYQSTISPEQIENIQKTVSFTSQSTTIASTSMSIAQGVLQTSSCGLLVSGLTSQKLTYMLLVITKLPEAVQLPLEATKGQIPSEQFQLINFLNVIFSEKEDQDTYYNAKFKSVNLKFSIFATCGQGVSIVLICETLFAIIYLFQEKIKLPKMNSVFSQLYAKLFAGLIIQYIQLASSIFSIGISSQILELTSKDEIEYKTPKIILMIILIPLIGLINFKIYYFLNIQKSSTTQSFSQITREKVQNETISESKIRRNFMMILIVILSIIQPVIFILLNQSYIAICVIILIVQVGYFVLVFYLMPFYSKITNLYFLIDSILWLALYIQFLIINIFSTSENIDAHATSLDNTCWIFIATVQCILMLNPIYLVVTVISKVIDLIKQKYSSKFQQFNSTSILLLPEQNKFEICDVGFDQLYRQIQYSTKIELSSMQTIQTKSDIITKQKQFDKIRSKFSQFNKKQPLQ